MKHETATYLASVKVRLSAERWTSLEAPHYTELARAGAEPRRLRAHLALERRERLALLSRPGVVR